MDARAQRGEDRGRRLLAHADARLAAADWEAAARAYRDALALAPDCADAWFNLGFALRRQGGFAEALDAYASALAAGVAQPELAHLNRAAIYSDQLRDDSAALAELQAALRIVPGHPPALLNLGNLHEERGEREAAIGCYRQLIDSASPVAQGLVVQALARLVDLLPPDHPDDDLMARAHSYAHRTNGAADGDRASLLFAVGRACDRRGAYVQAFDAFAQGKRLAHHRQPAYDPEQASRLTAALMATAARCETARPPVSPQRPQPLFICGMFRSGSTLVEQVLAAHSRVVAGGELDLLPRMATGALAPFPATLAHLDDARRDALAAVYADGVASRFPDMERAVRYLTDKRPDNYRLVGLIKRLFPEARIINTVRDPRDNGLAIFMQHLNPRAFPYAGTLEGIGHHYGEYRRLLDYWKALYPADIHDFDYDAFVAQPVPVLRALLAFLELPWEEGCLSFHTRPGTVKTASHWQVRRPLYADASGRWRRYRTQLEPLLATLHALGIAPEDAGDATGAPAR